MRILLLTHSFNSLTQRLFVELRQRGHLVSVEFDIADSVTEEAVALFAPDLVIAPFLKRAIPERIWSRLVCLVVHPGIVGDRGPSALDWAIVRDERSWGVTVLQANGEMDAGPVWASATFPMRAARKSSLYRNEVTVAAVQAVLEALAAFEAGWRSANDAQSGPGTWNPAMRQAERGIDWARESTAAVLAKLHAADSFPGVPDALFGQPCRLFDAHAATPQTVARAPRGQPGDIVARREHAVLRLTVDAGVWIGHAKLAVRDEWENTSLPSLKLPVAQVFHEAWAQLPDLSLPLEHDAGEWSEFRYWEDDSGAGLVGYLAFDCYNGAMSTAQCQRLCAALRYARGRQTRVLVLLGGEDFFSNGIHLHQIEAAEHRGAESAADASWRNIQAMDDVALEILAFSDRMTVSALRGNAGAGGVFLALAADQVWAREGVLVNPHYKNMGNLYGSEYWTYLLPQRVGAQRASDLMDGRLPMSVRRAIEIGLIDASLDGDARSCLAEIGRRAVALARAPDYAAHIDNKRRKRAADEAAKPLAQYREEELVHMHRNFYGFDPSYHVARYHFVYKLPHAHTPRHLAMHRGGSLPAAQELQALAGKRS
ncbi:HoxX (plasmid) [Cupriavidus necator H16]|uniref:Hydrogenase maturation protein n=2 Tax=Cupriavidus necator TaxID=106590 RepID=Q79IP8_CUPNH|nr:hydrogenase maturation protein [Cupriavidus necator]AAP85774.1 HypX [Cupriavidus necator H16]QCC05306.1 hydrogenase maturation protein [Cupriavidus necator H16]QQB81477.1 hydrogenase maturation protein [Cupriavidus necator]CAA52735.1 HoxX [Cupriavidus necator H16]